MSGSPVSCPDWTALVALRERADADGSPEPADWAAALEHLDGCPRCRRQAVAADPLLVFRRLPGAEMPGERAEAEAMVQAVAAMRTAERLESRRRFAGWRRWAAAAVLALVSLSVGRDRDPLLAPQPAMPAIPATPVVSLPETASPAANSAVNGAATLERLDSSDARVYQLNGKDLSVFMIVDHKIDV
ncbi:MAG TPA: hypothetical protein VGG20_06885 [Thermoanaerobaculia bacterium]|jgi:hypothetical protein